MIPTIVFRNNAPVPRARMLVDRAVEGRPQLVIIPADNAPAYLIREQDNKEAHTRHLMGAR